MISKYQKLIKAIADQLSITPADLMVMKLNTCVHMMDGIPYYNHEDALMAAFAVKEDIDA